MDGITILHSTLYNDYLWTGIILGILSVATCIVVFFMTKDFGWDELSVFFIIAGIIVLGMSSWLIVSSLTNRQEKYYVTIDESVSFIEFYEKYEILNQKSNIYEVIEKQ